MKLRVKSPSLKGTCIIFFAISYVVLCLGLVFLMKLDVIITCFVFSFSMNMLTSLILIIVCLINMYSHLQQSVNSYS